jgi:uncharacterized protein YjbJ (UPF0337 family)
MKECCWVEVAAIAVSFGSVWWALSSLALDSTWRLAMNWDEIAGKWKQSVGKVKEKWGKLTDDDLTAINGKKDQLVGKIQERYGIAKDAAEKQVDEFTRSYRAGKAAKSS